MPIEKFKHPVYGLEMTIARPAPGVWVIGVLGKTITTGGDGWNLDVDFGDDEGAWADFIIEAFCDAGEIEYDEWGNGYVTSEAAEENAQEARWQREHENSYRLKVGDVL